MKILFIIAGTLSVVIGVIGIVVPLLPTVPFLLLAAYCYAKGSQQFYLWLMNHRWLGEIIQNYRAGKGLPMQVRIISTLFLWATICTSLFFLVDNIMLKIVMIAVAIGVSVHLMLMKGK